MVTRAEIFLNASNMNNADDFLKMATSENPSNYLLYSIHLNVNHEFA
jgi:hypothetical protein